MIMVELIMGDAVVEEGEGGTNEGMRGEDNFSECVLCANEAESCAIIRHVVHSRERKREIRCDTFLFPTLLCISSSCPLRSKQRNG